MKTRHELLLDFMLALASNPAMTPDGKDDKAVARDIFLLSAELADKAIGLGL
jgi:hypothetical protein